MNTTIKAALTAALTLLSGAALAQAFPAKSIRIVVPFAPGGNVDINARAIAPGMTELLGQTVVVDNRAGAGGMIGAEIVAKSPADGYTLGMFSNSVYSVAPNVFAKPLYNPIRDFTPVVALTSVPFVLVIHPSVPAKTLKEFVAIEKSRPGKMTLANAGVGTSNHLVGELIQLSTGTKMASIPYKGSGPALNDVMAGHVQIMFDGIPSALPLVQSGRLRALAVTGLQRSPALPDVPTVAETIPGFDASGWFAVYAPAGTPRAIVTKLNEAINRVLQMPDVRQRYAALGAEVVGGSTDKLREQVQKELAKWSELIKQTGMKAE